MTKSNLQFFVDYNFPIDQLTTELYKLVDCYKTHISITPNSSCGGNTQVDVFTDDADDLAAMLEYSNYGPRQLNGVHIEADPKSWIRIEL